MSKYRFLLINAFSLAPGSDFAMRSYTGPKETQLYNYEDLKPFLADIGWELFHLILDVASGRKQVCADKLGLHNALALFNPAPVT